MILTNCVVGEENIEDSSLNNSLDEEEDKELEKIINLQQSKSYFLFFISLSRKK